MAGDPLQILLTNSPKNAKLLELSCMADHLDKFVSVPTEEVRSETFNAKTRKLNQALSTSGVVL